MNYKEQAEKLLLQLNEDRCGYSAGLVLIEMTLREAALDMEWHSKNKTEMERIDIFESTLKAATDAARAQVVEEVLNIVSYPCECGAVGQNKSPRAKGWKTTLKRMVNIIGVVLVLASAYGGFNFSEKLRCERLRYNTWDDFENTMKINNSECDSYNNKMGKSICVERNLGYDKAKFEDIPLMLKYQGCK